MPHKKSKKSIRDTETAARGFDNAPSAKDAYNIPYASTSTAEDKVVKKPRKAKVDAEKNSFGGRQDLGGVSKSVYRILNAGAVREEFQNNKRKREEDEKAAIAKKGVKKALVQLPYESNSAFNRRVETAMRPDIDIAIKASKSANKKRGAKKPKLEDPSVTADVNIASKSSNKSTKPSIDPLVPPPKPQIVRNGLTEFSRPSQIKQINDIAMAPPTLKIRKVASVNNPLPSHRMPVSASIKLAMEVERERAVQTYRALKEKRDSEQKKEHGKE